MRSPCYQGRRALYRRHRLVTTNVTLSRKHQLQSSPGSPGQRLEQGSRVIAATVHDAIDEQRRRAQHLSRRHPAPHISANPAQHQGACPVVVEPRGIQSEVRSVMSQITATERLLPVKQQVVHVPDPALARGGLGRGRRGEGVRVDLSQREIPEGEPDGPAQFFLDTLDFPVRLPGIRAFVIAVLQDEAAGRGAAEMIGRAFNRSGGGARIGGRRSAIVLCVMSSFLSCAEPASRRGSAANPLEMRTCW